MLTRSQIENLTREQLIEELLQLSDISNQLKVSNAKSDTFAVKYEGLKSDSLITKNCNTLLHQCTIQLERNAVNNAQYHRGESLEVTVCRTISLTGHEVTPDDLHSRVID